MSTSAYPIDPSLTAIAVAYKNEEYIADMVAPRITVGAEQFTRLQYKADAFYALPETRVGRRSAPNEVNLEASEVPGMTEDHGLDGGVPQNDIKNAESYKSDDGGQVYDPLGDETMLLSELVMARREKRVADLVMNPATYDAQLQEVLAAGDKFSNPLANIIDIMNEALDMPLVRPNQIIFGQGGWTKFKSHPQIVEAIKGTGAAAGNVLRQQVAELFEVKEVLVGSARANVAKPGQVPQLARMWGNAVALLHKAPVPQVKGACTFMGTFQWGPKVAMQWPNPKMGLRGGIGVRAGESVVEKVIANQAGYLLREAF